MTISKASKEAGIARRTLYDMRDRDHEFRAAWDAAYEQAVDSVEQEVWERAFDRNDRESAKLLMFLLKGLKPIFKDTYKDKPIQIEHIKEFKISDKDISEAIDILTASSKPKDGLEDLTNE